MRRRTAPGRGKRSAAPATSRPSPARSNAPARWNRCTGEARHSVGVRWGEARYVAPVIERPAGAERPSNPAPKPAALVVPDLMRSRLAATPDAVAFNLDGRAGLTFREWDRRSNR